MKMPNPEDFTTPSQAIVDFFSKPTMVIDGKLIPVKGFKLTNNAPVKPKPDFAFVGKKYEITGDIEIQWDSVELHKKYDDAISGKTWQSLYEGKFAMDPGAPGGDKTGYFKRRTIPHYCPPPHTTDIDIPSFTKRELIDERAVMSAVFQRLLTIMRLQRTPGYEVGTDLEGNATSVKLYRTKQGGRCPYGYLIPDEIYHPNMEGMCANNPVIMDAMGLRCFIGNEQVERFLGNTQEEMHDSIAGDRHSFMDAFEIAARRMAAHYHLYYYEQGEGRGIPEWARV